MHVPLIQDLILEPLVLLMIIMKTADSNVVALLWYPKKPGMTREELIGINAGIVKSC
jgi:malate/lactate dehydrogenase